MKSLVPQAFFAHENPRTFSFQSQHMVKLDPEVQKQFNLIKTKINYLVSSISTPTCALIGGAHRELKTFWMCGGIYDEEGSGYYRGQCFILIWHLLKGVLI